MGRAVTAVVDNWESLYTNPAGLALIEDASWRMPDLVQGSISSSVSGLYKKIKNIKDSGRTVLPADLYDFDGTEAGFGMDILPMGYYRPRFGFALNPFNMQSSVRVRTPSLLFLKATARFTQDSAISVGYAQPLFKNRLRIGATVRPFHLRTGMDLGMTNDRALENSQITSFDDPNAFAGMGWGYDFDLGMQADAGRWGRFGFRPSVGFVMQNILNNRFDQRLQEEELNGDIPAMERRWNVGAAFALESLGKLRPTVSVELRDFMIAADSMVERLSVALELNLVVKKWLRGSIATHFYKGQIGGGIYGNMGPGELALVTDAVSLGKAMGVGVMRRYYLRLGVAW